MSRDDSDGRDGALARLAESVRHLIDVTVTIDAPADAVTAAAARIDRVVDELRAVVPNPPPPRYPGGGGTPSALFPYDYVMGKWNPLAAPLRIEWQDPYAVGVASFGTPYEGPPGCLHGGFVAAAFDDLLGFAQIASGLAGYTGMLTVRMRLPTPLNTRIDYEAWVDHVHGRKIFVRGTSAVGGTPVADAEILFIQPRQPRKLRPPGRPE